MEASKIYVKGARVNNLKDIDLELPRNKLIVFTGLSGSGKSSLAFDTLYAEGQEVCRISLRLCRDSSWDRWKNRMLTILRDYHRLSL